VNVKTEKPRQNFCFVSQSETGAKISNLGNISRNGKYDAETGGGGVYVPESQHYEN
jgi:hypothetical protein